MKNWLIFLARLLLISLLLFSLGDWIGMVYQMVLRQVCSCFLHPPQGTIRLEYTSYLRTIPFLALMLATPEIPLKRRLAIICAGLVTYLGMDTACNLTWGSFPTKGAGAGHALFTLVWQTTGQWILPFLFWAVAVNKICLKRS